MTRRTVFLGTSDFAAAVLARLADSPHRPQLVVTRPDRPAGRGRRLSAPPVADAARALDLELAQPENVNADDARAQIAAAAPDVVVVCAFGALIREPLLSDFEMLNVHPSLLPRWRGAAPVERAIMAGDEETGVCIMRVTAGLDSGPVHLMGREPIAPDDTYGTLTPRLQELSADLLLRRARRAPRSRRADRGGRHVRREDRPRRPHARPGRAAPGQRPRRARADARTSAPAWCSADGAFLGVLRAAVREPGAAGELRADGGRLLLGGLELLEVQPAGGRPMDAAAYLRGRGL